jgi:hypothetical protein
MEKITCHSTTSTDQVSKNGNVINPQFLPNTLHIASHHHYVIRIGPRTKKLSEGTKQEQDTGEVMARPLDKEPEIGSRIANTVLGIFEKQKQLKRRI